MSIELNTLELEMRKEDNVDIIKSTIQDLIQRGFNVNKTYLEDCGPLLEHALLESQNEIAKYAIDECDAVITSNALLCAINMRNHEMVQYLLQNRNKCIINNECIQSILEYEDIETLKMCIDLAGCFTMEKKGCVLCYSKKPKIKVLYVPSNYSGVFSLHSNLNHLLQKIN